VSDHARTGVVVAIDGPSGSGKSSTSRGVAARLGLRYLDTGAMYRAITWWMLEQGVPVGEPAAVAARCGEPVIVSGTDPLAPTITADGVDVSQAIRSPAVTAAVSAVSAVPEVRARLLVVQREAIDGGGIVVEGRDIGAVVAPDAEVKVYLTADVAARAARRAAEAGGTLHPPPTPAPPPPRRAAEEGGTDLAATESSLLARDRFDSTRTASPLTMAAGAVHLDTTPYTLDEVITLIVGLVEDVVEDDR
jgi:CMP/dCMP kinase